MSQDAFTSSGGLIERWDKSQKALRLDSAFWRRLAWLGAARGPRFWLRYSPPFIGVIAALLARDKRRQVQQNLQAMLGPRPWLTQARDVFRTFMCFAQCLADSLALSGESRYQIQLELQGKEHIEKALAKNKGLILLTAHSAGWEIALLELRKTLSQPLMVVMQPERDAKARQYHQAVSDQRVAQVVDSGQDPLGALPLLHQLRKGGVVAVQLDRCPKNMRGCEVRLWGKAARVPEGPFRLAAITGAPLMTVFSCRTGFLAYRLRISEPTWVPGRTPEIIASSAQKAAEQLEAFVSGHPTQWFHFSEG